MADFGITLGYETDACSVCKKKKEVRYVYNIKQSTAAGICDECVNSFSNFTIQELLERFGKKIKKEKIKIMTKEQLERSGFELTGKKQKN